jgi:hypothetical protein
MSGQYRVLQYMANPFSGLCLPVAALVLDAGGRLHVMLAPSLPSAELVGRRTASLLVTMRPEIAALDSFERLPRGFGPQFVLTKPESIAADDPLRWVEDVLFPRAA